MRPSPKLLLILFIVVVVGILVLRARSAFGV